MPSVPTRVTPVRRPAASLSKARLSPSGWSIRVISPRGSRASVMRLPLRSSIAARRQTRSALVKHSRHE